MTGKVLGYDNQTNEGTISATDGKRYKFTKENWKDSNSPSSNMEVDFEISEDNIAKDIYVTKNITEENNTMIGLVAVGLTFFFGFIGTFVSRLFLAKRSVGETLLPTGIHFVLTLLFLIPVLGWIIYLAGTGYYMYKNYKLIVD